MTVNELSSREEFSAVSMPEGEREISGVYIGDLLSWVMGRAKADNAWITIMSNINIAERVKEIATLKVLGFHDKETYRYVSRESSALTLIGALAGLVLGIWLHRFIITTVEVDAVMFGRQIQPLSFVYALVLTLLFGTVVNKVMGLRLKKISMVESMKAPE